MSERRWGNFSSCCRLCLSEKLGTLKSIFEDASRSREIVKNIRNSLGMDIQANDKLSTMICEQCLSKVNSWNDYRKFCSENQTKLLGWMNTWTSSNIADISIQIKDEVVEDSEEQPPAPVIVDDDDVIQVKSEPAENAFESEPMEDDIYDMPPPLTPHPPDEHVHSFMNGSDDEAEDEPNHSKANTSAPYLGENLEVNGMDAEIEEDCKVSGDLLISAKSKTRYEKTYIIFKKWINQKRVAINEKTLLDYFVQRSNVLKSPGSLWAEYSMLKTTINLNNGINISKFNKLVTFLKTKNIGHSPKTTKVFTREEIRKFLIEAPDANYLMMKAAMIMGVAGACRREELTNMTIDNINDKGSVVFIKVPNSKTNVHRTFTITNSDEEVDFLEIFRKYVQLRPKSTTNSRRFFYAMREGKCVNQVVGLNTMGRLPLKIAEYLNLEDPSLYTGHAFRRTSATLAADKG